MTLVILAACQRAPIAIEVDEQAVSVHSTLVAGADSVFVFVSRPRVRYEWEEVYLVPVPDASVTLSHAGVSTTLTYGRKCATAEGGGHTPDPVVTAECYAARLPEAIRSGETYELFVNAGATLVHGSVQVPAAAQIISPSAGSVAVFRVADRTSPLHAEWTNVDRQTIELRIVPEREDCYVTFALPEDELGGRLTHRVEGGTQQTLFPRPLSCDLGSLRTHQARLFVSKYDSGFERYHPLNRPESRRSEGVAVNLTGARGYFGAVANASVPITLVP